MPIHTSSQSIKQVRNQNHYLKKKISSAAVDTESLRIDLAASNRSIHNLQDEHDQQSVAMGQLKSELDDNNKNWNSKLRDGWGGGIERMKPYWMWSLLVQRRLRRWNLSTPRIWPLRYPRSSLSNIGRIGFTSRRFLLWRTNWRPFLNPMSKCTFWIIHCSCSMYSHWMTAHTITIGWPWQI